MGSFPLSFRRTAGALTVALALATAASAYPKYRPISAKLLRDTSPGALLSALLDESESAAEVRARLAFNTPAEKATVRRRLQNAALNADDDAEKARFEAAAERLSGLPQMEFRYLRVRGFEEERYESYLRQNGIHESWRKRSGFFGKRTHVMVWGRRAALEGLATTIGDEVELEEPIRSLGFVVQYVNARSGRGAGTIHTYTLNSSTWAACETLERLQSDAPKYICLKIKSEAFEGRRSGSLFDIEWTMKLAEDEDILDEGEAAQGSMYIEYDLD